MRVGIITITDYENYGNKLQNFALQTVLNKMGADVQTIPCRTLKSYKYSFVYKIAYLLLGYITKNKQRCGIALKQVLFDRFSSEHLNMSHIYATQSYIPKSLNQKFDRFVAGSDQIWNPYSNTNWDLMFLSFADHKKRVAYAASFGVSKIPANKRADFKKRIMDMCYVSVREYSAVKIIKELTGLDVTLLVDPTLLMTKNEWVSYVRTKINKAGKIPNGSYILAYYLGTRSSKDVAISKAQNCDESYKSIPVYDLSMPENVCEYSHDPFEFVYLIQHAQLVVTDSFHGVVFSILMEVPFFYTERVDNNAPMTSRVQSLFRQLGMEVRVGMHTEHIEHNEEISAALRNQRNKAMAFLKKALAEN